MNANGGVKDENANDIYLQSYEIACGTAFPEESSVVLLSLLCNYPEFQRSFVYKYDFQKSCILHSMEVDSDKYINSINVSLSKKFLLLHSCINTIQIYKLDLNVCRRLFTAQ